MNSEAEKGKLIEQRCKAFNQHMHETEKFQEAINDYLFSGKPLPSALPVLESCQVLTAIDALCIREGLPTIL